MAVNASSSAALPRAGRTITNPPPQGLPVAGGQTARKVVDPQQPSNALLGDAWAHAYTREEAAYPVATLRRSKYLSPVARIDNVYGDRNLFCSCVPMSAYE